MWAANGCDLRVREIVLIMDCLRDAAGELVSPDVAIIQHESGECGGHACVWQVTDVQGQ